MIGWRNRLRHPRRARFDAAAPSDYSSRFSVLFVSTKDTEIRSKWRNLNEISTMLYKFVHIGSQSQNVTKFGLIR